MTTTTLLVMTDGRPCITETIRSAEANLHGNITRRIIHNDSGERDHQDWLVEQFPGYETIFHPGRREGFGGAIRCAWQEVRDSDFVFHLEDDFTFNRPVDLRPLVGVLAAYPRLIQIALRRQPWNDEERAAGGIVEQHPEDYVEKRLDQAVNFTGEKDAPPDRWLEHRRFFTTNPSLYRGSLCRDAVWPTGPDSEGRFWVFYRREHPDAVCAFWGPRDSGEWVTHIGRERVGAGY